MISFGDYCRQMEGLAHPRPLPEDMAISYAMMCNSPIEYVKLDKIDEVLKVKLVGVDGYLIIYDNGQSCCERRYITCDDELDSYVGAKIVGFEAVRGPDVELEADEDGWVSGDAHEQMFVKLETTSGTITLTTHNEHNGYYGGFALVTSWRL